MMKRNCLTALLTLLTLTCVYGQTTMDSCECPRSPYAGMKADTTFHLANGKSIVLCSYENPGSSPATFSEFLLSVCGQDSIIGFWGAVLTCRLKVNKDTLLVDQLENLPTGKNFKFQEAVWTTEKIYFVGQQPVTQLSINRHIGKYTPGEIQVVLKNYETSKKGLDDSKLKIANELFIAAISGSKKARHYFKEFKNKFGTLDGVLAEEYNELAAMLALWDNKK